MVSYESRVQPSQQVQGGGIVGKDVVEETMIAECLQSVFTLVPSPRVIAKVFSSTNNVVWIHVYISNQAVDKIFYAAAGWMQ